MKVALPLYIGILVISWSEFVRRAVGENRVTADFWVRMAVLVCFMTIAVQVLMWRRTVRISKDNRRSVFSINEDLADNEGATIALAVLGAAIAVHALYLGSLDGTDAGAGAEVGLSPAALAAPQPDAAYAPQPQPGPQPGPQAGPQPGPQPGAEAGGGAGGASGASGASGGTPVSAPQGPALNWVKI